MHFNQTTLFDDDFTLLASNDSFIQLIMNYFMLAYFIHFYSHAEPSSPFVQYLKITLHECERRDVEPLNEKGCESVLGCR